MGLRFGKNQKLKSRKLIAKLFSVGKVVKAYPLRAVYLPIDEVKDDFQYSLAKNSQLAFSVPKRRFKLAVDRNKSKGKCEKPIDSIKISLGEITLCS